MTTTNFSDVVNQVIHYWGPVYSEEFRQKFVLPALIDRTPGGLSTLSMGDRVRVSQVNKTTGQIRTTAQCDFTPELLATQYVDIICDKRAVSSLEFCDYVELMSQINIQRADVREAMRHGMLSQINTVVYGVVNPTVEQTAVATIDAAKLTELGKLADEAFWPEDQRWLLVDPLYKKQLLDDATLTSADFGATDVPVIGGQVVLERYGWKIVMDNSAAMKSVLNASAAGVALAFTPSWASMVVAREDQIKISDRHSNYEFKVVMSVDTVFGVGLNNDGADKHIVVRTGV
jgi:hypothetical protein